MQELEYIRVLNTFGAETARWMNMAFKAYWITTGLEIAWLVFLTWVMLCSFKKGK